MSVIFAAVKCFVFAFNFFSLVSVAQKKKNIWEHQWKKSVFAVILKYYCLASYEYFAHFTLLVIVWPTYYLLLFIYFYTFCANFSIFLQLLGICIVCLNIVGLEFAIPNTDEHTYCIVGIILGSFVCMATLFGCYGVICESLGVNVIVCSAFNFYCYLQINY